MITIRRTSMCACVMGYFTHGAWPRPAYIYLVMARLHRIFVYGTLKQGQPNHHVLLESEGTAHLLGTARLTEKYPLVVSKFGIPVLLAKNGVGKIVRGEIYEVDAAKLTVLDALEDHPDLYTRTPTLCHIATPATQSPPPSPPPPSSSQTTSTLAPTASTCTTTECEIYMMFDYRGSALQMPHLDCYDIATLPKSMRVLPASERSKKLAETIHKDLQKFKNSFCTA